jgi:AcrR family transcriptional regulator
MLKGMAKESYHHGDLRRTLLDTAATAIAEDGPAALSLRELARRAGVSHAAPTHHFGDKKGLLTALAAEGFDQLAAALRETRAATGSFLELGVTYVRFAVTHRAHFEVMWRPDLYRADDPVLVAARDRSSDALYSGVAELPDDRPSAAAAVTAPGRPGAAAMATAPGRPSAAGVAVTAPGTAAGAGGEAVREAGLAGWALAHGFATLWLSGSLPDTSGPPDEAARAVLRHLGHDGE